MKHKVVIIGAGHVGSHCASALAMGNIIDEVVLLDKENDKARAQSMDIADSVSFLDGNVLVRSGDYSDCKDAQIVVVAVGKPRLPGQTRLDLLDESMIMARDVARHLLEVSYEGIVITITNPADVIADCIRKEMRGKRWRIFSTGTLLDTARLLRILHEETGYDTKSIQAVSMGEHGDSSMIPFSNITIGGIAFDQFEGISREYLLERTRGIGMDIINGKGSTEFGIGLALATMVKAIIKDEKKVMPASVLLEGEYGQTGVHCGVPCVIGKGGVEKIIEFPLEQEELIELKKSCDVIREYIERGERK
ncbi:MAG: L-lactate dehydrogenase [Lachnospiraceae bacterium]